MKLTPRIVNAKLKKMSIPVVMYRSPSGYYYFAIDSKADPHRWGRDIESLMSFNLDDFTIEDIVSHIITSIRM